MVNWTPTENRAERPHRYQHILQFIYSQPFAILPDYVGVVRDIVLERAGGYIPTEDEIRARIGAGPREVEAAVASAPRRPSGGVAVLPLYGVLSQRMNMMSEVSGGTSTETFARNFRSAISDPAIASVLIDVDSPGGSVYGVPELTDEIYRARGTKPIVAIANSMAASAAYWVATAADELVVTPSGDVGSIGVYTMHQDFSKAEELAGVKTTLISAGRYKVEGNEFAPLGVEAQAAVQARVDQFYRMFTNAVARDRGRSAAEIRGGFGEGRLVGAEDALRLGMVDRVATFDETAARMLRSAGPARSSRSAAADLDFRRRRLRLAGSRG
jgi:signal peptide peptidase SppA